MLRHQSAKTSSFVRIFLSRCDSFLFGGVVGPRFLLKGSCPVLEELLLPAVEHRRLEPQFVTQIRDRHSFHQMPPQNGDLLFRRVVLPLLRYLNG